MIDIRREMISSVVVTELFRALDQELSDLYPEPGANHFELEEDEVAQGSGAVFVAYAGEVPVACGAIKRLDGDKAELKRMYVSPAARGQGVAGTLMNALQDEARQLGVRTLVLETGDRQPGALALAGQFGFRRIPPFGKYLDSPLSVCMGKNL